MMRSRARYVLACWLSMGCGGRETAEVDLDASNAIDASPGGDVDRGGACAADVREGTPLPVDIYLVVDNSDVMNCVPNTGVSSCASDSGLPPDKTHWGIATSAVERFAAAPGGTHVALGFFPRYPAGTTTPSCLEDDYAAPDLPFEASAAAITDLIRTRTPHGDWHFQAPLAGALRYARAHAEANHDRQTVVAFMTPGSTVSPCSSVDTFDGANQMAASAWAAAVPVKTTVIAHLPGLLQLFELAEAGGSTGYSVGAASMNSRDEMLAELQAAAAPCDYLVSETPQPGRTPRVIALQVRRGGDGAFSPISRMVDASQCTLQGGWYANNNQIPSRLSLCPETCRLMTTIPGSVVRLVVGCWS